MAMRVGFLCLMLSLFSGLSFGQKSVTVINALDSTLVFPSSVESDCGKFRADSLGKIELMPCQKYIFRSFGYEIKMFTWEELVAGDFIVFLEPSIILLDEIYLDNSNLGAYRLENGIKKIVNISTDSLASKVYTNTPEILEKSGAVFMQRSQFGGGSPVLRGFEANRILLLVDGVRINNAITRSGHFQGMLTLDASIVDEIDLMFGPNSLAYGSDGLGGAINMKTKNPKYAEKKEVSGTSFLRYSSAEGEKTLRQSVSILNIKSAFDLTLRLSDYSDLKSGKTKNFFDHKTWLKIENIEQINGKDSIVVNPNPYQMIKSGYSQLDMNFKWRAKTKKGNEHQIFTLFSTSTDIPRYDRLSEYKDKVLKYSEWNYGPQYRLLSYYKYRNYQVKKLWDYCEFTASFQFNQESRITRNFSSPTQNNRISNVYLPAVSFVAIKSLVDKGEIQYGLDNYQNYVTDNSYAKDIYTSQKSALVSRYPASGASYHTNGVYLLHSYEKKKWAIHSGVRADYLSTNFDLDTSFVSIGFKKVSQKNLSISGGFGAQYLFTKKIAGIVNLQSAYRNPNIDDLGKVFDSKAGEVIIPNTALKAERTVSLEYITRLKFNRISLDGGANYTRIFRQISTSYFSINGEDSILYDGTQSRILANQNNEFGGILGLFYSLEWKINSRNTLSSTATYTRGVLNTGSPLGHIPPIYGRMLWTKNWTKSSRVRTEFLSWFNFRKSLKTYNYSGEDRVENASENGMPAILLFDLMGYYKFKAFNFYGGVKNILDTHYRTFSSGINGAGRSFVVGVQWNY